MPTNKRLQSRVIIILLFVGIHVSNVIAVKLTLSEQGLMLLDEYSAYMPDYKATILEKRHIEGVGVECDIYFPGNEYPNNNIFYVFSPEMTQKVFKGVEVASCDAFELKFTIIAVDGSTSEENTGALVVGSYLGRAYGPEVISLAENQPRSAISTTSMDTDKVIMAGITAHMLTKEGWKPDGTTVTLLIEPVLQDNISVPLKKSDEKNESERRIIYVDSSAYGGNKGSSWADAFKHLQDGLNVASEGNEIWVANGTYKPDLGANKKKGDQSLAFVLKKGVAIYGGFPVGGGTWEERRSVGDTILSGDLRGNDADSIEPSKLLDDETRNDNSYHVVSASGTNYETLLDGFVITAGNAKGPSQSNFDNGGGLYCKTGGLTLSNCVLKSNAAVDGGAVCNLKGNPMMYNCVFLENYSNDRGGAVFSASGSQLVYNCVFTSNTAKEKGGGIYNEFNSPIMTNCTVYGNTAYAGGGIYCHKSKPIIKNSILWDNNSRYGKLEPSQIYAVEAIIEHSCIQGLTEQLQGNNNISVNPGFLDIENNDVGLKENSPCIDTGDNEALPQELQMDVDGTERIKDGNNDGTAQIDMGAQEF